MASAERTDTSVPLSWIVIFLLLALGLGVVAIQFVGGSLVQSGAFVVPPLFSV